MDKKEFEEDVNRGLDLSDKLGHFLVKQNVTIPIAFISLTIVTINTMLNSEDPDWHFEKFVELYKLRSMDGKRDG